MGMLNTLAEIMCGTSKTKQKVGVEHDINKIVAKFKKTGQLPVLQDRLGQFVDTISIGDYQTCLEKIRTAQELFESYPSAIRRKFDNDSTKFLAYCDELKSNPKLINDAENLGLIIVNNPDLILHPTGNKNDKEAIK